MPDVASIHEVRERPEKFRQLLDNIRAAGAANVYERALLVLDEALSAIAQERDEVTERAAKAETMAYVPGRWRCAKCALVLTSTNLYVADGSMSPDNEPRPCPNSCGPMWRVSERDERREAQQSFNDLWDRHEALKRRHDERQTELLAANNAEVGRRRGAVAETKVLREAIHKVLIAQSHRMLSGGGTRHVGYHCRSCRSDWTTADLRILPDMERDALEEWHKPDCPLRTTLAQPATGDNWVTQVFAPLPRDEAETLRDVL